LLPYNYVENKDEYKFIGSLLVKETLNIGQHLRRYGQESAYRGTRFDPQRPTAPFFGGERVYIERNENASAQ